MGVEKDQETGLQEDGNFCGGYEFDVQQRQGLQRR